MFQRNREKSFCKAKDQLIYLSYQLEFLIVDTNVLLSSWKILERDKNKMSSFTVFKGGQFQLQTLLSFTASASVGSWPRLLSIVQDKSLRWQLGWRPAQFPVGIQRLKLEVPEEELWVAVSCLVTPSVLSATPDPQSKSRTLFYSPDFCSGNCTSPLDLRGLQSIYFEEYNCIIHVHFSHWLILEWE